uniref:NAD-binding protein n=1 Tax=Dyadobacter beijingensis TaxID=365489 RepID=UPI0035B5B722
MADGVAAETLTGGAHAEGEFCESLGCEVVLIGQSEHIGTVFDAGIRVFCAVEVRERGIHFITQEIDVAAAGNAEKRQFTFATGRHRYFEIQVLVIWNGRSSTELQAQRLE